MKHLLRALGVAACASSLLFTSFACGSNGTAGSGGGFAGSGGGNNGGSGGTGGSGGSGGTGGTCEPKKCSQTSECGTYDDSCGGKITCTGMCPCTATDFSMCPQKPCQTVTGCSDKYACTYAPVTCGAATCAPQACTTGVDCDTICHDAACTSGLYPCGGHVCKDVAQYCDPRPTQQGGVTTFANVCVDPPANVGCGTCDLGLRSCDTNNDVFACQDIPFPTGGSNQCSDLDTHTTFVYVDPKFNGDHKGTRGRPFSTVADAVTAAKDPARGGAVRGIIIGGSPTFTETLVVADGISIYGGYMDYLHDFLPDPTQRPHWLVSTPTGDPRDNRVVGAMATNIVNPTVLHHLDIKTADLGANDNNQGFGTSTMGFVAVNAGALQLDDVTITAGRAGDGKPGVDAPVDPNGKGPDAVGSAAGDNSLTSCAQPRCPAVPGNYNCGDGGLGVAPGNGMAGQAASGAPGDDPITLNGGTGGEDATPADSMMCDPLVTQATAGAPGLKGKDGADHGAEQGSSATRGHVDDSGLWKPGIANPGPPGARGTWGSGGGAGGGVLNMCGGPCGDLGCKGGDGGGGGAPGCGGAGGNAGGSGGVSIALAAVNSSGMKVTGCSLKSNGGGKGALGGKGAAGYAGGKGEKANRCVGLPCDPAQDDAAEGGIGGDGGKGGGGGKGGDGAGGDSAAVYCVGAPVTPTGGTQDAGTAGTGAGNGQAGQAAPAIGCG